MKRHLVMLFALAIAALWFGETSGLTQGLFTRSAPHSQSQKHPAKVKAKNTQKKNAQQPTTPQQQSVREEEDTRVEEEFLRQRMYPFDRIPDGAYERAQQQWNQFGGAVSEDFAPGQKNKGRLLLSGVNGTVWAPIGPSPIHQGASNANGRVNAIAVNPNNPNLLYIGAAFGGVWRSNNGGANWTPLFDQQPSLGVGESNALAIDPNNTNTIYVGTSSRFFSTVAFQNRQGIRTGILKSTDGGSSWAVLGADFPPGVSGNADAIFSNANVNRIIVDPANSNLLYAASSGGLFVSNDGGRNWTQGAGGNGDAQTLVLDTSTPTNARVLFAGVNGSGVLRSMDGGQNWTRVLSQTTAAVAAAVGMGGSFGKVAVAIAPPAAAPNPNGVQVVYVTVEGRGGAANGLVFQSVNQGTSWSQRAGNFPMGSRNDTQGGFNLTLGVDPASPGDGANDVVYYGGVGQFRSTDSGANFASVQNGMHVDTHADWVFVRRAGMPSLVYTGNDGGVWRSEDDGAHWTGTGMSGAPATINAGGLQTALVYNLTVKNDATASVTLGSLQDNGIIRSAGSVDWTDTKGGDGWDVRFDAVNTDRVYHSGGFYCCGNPCTLVFRSTDGGSNWPDVIRSGIPDSELGCALAAITVDPNQAGVLYVSGLTTSLFQSSDGGGSYRNIGNLGGGVGYASVAPGNSNAVVAAAGNQVFVSTNALASTVGAPSGVTFANITRNLPNRMVARVAFDPNDATVIYATLSGFNSGHIFRTTVSGSAWTDLSPTVGGGAVFDAPFNALALDGSTTPTTLYAGTDLGVIRSVDAGASWTVLDDQHLPNVPITDLAFNSQARVLRAATFGRGVFELQAASGPVIAVSLENGAVFNACVGQSATANVQVYNVGTANLQIDSVQRLFGSTDFSVLPLPATPLIIAPGASVNFTVKFMPTTPGTQTATIRINSGDPSSPSYDVTVTGTSAASTIAAVIADSGNFGDVCVGSFKDLALTINNSGGCDLIVSSISSSLPAEFQTAGVISFPLVIGAGDSIQIPIRFRPTSFGIKSATITINSNDPATAAKTVNVSGNAPTATIIVNDPIIFDNTCPGNTNNKTLTIGNSGGCDLIVKSITSSSPEFKVVGVVPFPLVIPPGSTRDVAIQFMPMGFNVNPVHMATLTIMSNDLNTPNKTVTVKGTVPPPVIQVMPDPLDFGKVCLGKSKDLPLTIKNTGDCNLTVSNVTSNSPEFTLPNLPALPIVIPPGGMRDITVRFTPASTGMKSGKITITSDDPATPVKMVTVMGTAPVSAIAITGDFDWGDVLVGKYKEQVINITNTEECDLAITLVCEIKNVVPQQPSVEFSVVTPLNYPVVIPAGKTLPVAIRFKPAKKGPREATLIVFGYDPQTSNLVLTTSVPLKGNGK